MRKKDKKPRPLSKYPETRRSQQELAKWREEHQIEEPSPARAILNGILFGIIHPETVKEAAPELVTLLPLRRKLRNGATVSVRGTYPNFPASLLQEPLDRSKD